MAGWLRLWGDDPEAGSLRSRLQVLGTVPPDGLRRIQVTAIGKIEASMRSNRPRALAQMATGSGKTFMAANLAYRLVLQAGAGRVLFLVDRANLGPTDAEGVPAVRANNLSAVDGAGRDVVRAALAGPTDDSGHARTRSPPS